MFKSQGKDDEKYDILETQLQASSRFSPLGHTVIPPGIPLCSFKLACQDDLRGTLQSGH